MCYEIIELREGTTKDYINVKMIHTDYPAEIFSIEVGQVPYCCGATMICGLNRDYCDIPTEDAEDAVHAMLTDFDKWKDAAEYFPWTSDLERKLGGLLTRCKLIVIDAVLGESDEVGSLSRMALRNEGWSQAGLQQLNANSGNEIAIYEYNQAGIDQI